MTQETLYIILVCLIGLSVLALVAILIGYLSKRNAGNKNKKVVNMVKNTTSVETVKTSNAPKTKKDTTKTVVDNSRQNISDKSDIKNITVDFVENFMEFDEISDNMIVQNNGDKYLMVIKCQGINYDLMSANEMVAVEEGFIQFLNTLRFPIQLYVQTSSLDLTDSLREYNDRVEQSYNELTSLQIRLKRMEEFDEGTEDDMDALKYEIKKKQNIYDYGKDVIQGVERISKNKSILKQNYYVVVPYFASELGGHNFTPQEIKEMAFSELYTRCKGLIGSLQVCSVEAKILNSFELAELLYLAYNRDEGEIFSFRNAIEAQYDRLYHTAPDVMDKKIAILEEEILETAASKANEQIIKAAGFLPGDVDENNEMIQKLIYDNQKEYIKDYSNLISDDIIKAAISNATTEYKETKKQLHKKDEEQELVEDEDIENEEELQEDEDFNIEIVKNETKQKTTHENKQRKTSTKNKEKGKKKNTTKSIVGGEE